MQQAPHVPDRRAAQPLSKQHLLSVVDELNRDVAAGIASLRRIRRPSDGRVSSNDKNRASQALVKRDDQALERFTPPSEFGEPLDQLSGRLSPHPDSGVRRRVVRSARARRRSASTKGLYDRFSGEAELEELRGGGFALERWHSRDGKRFGRQVGRALSGFSALNESSKTGNGLR